ENELVKRFLGVRLNHAVKVNVRLHRELATPQPRYQTRVEADAGALGVLLGLGQLERPLPRDEVRQFGQHLGVLAHDILADGRIDGEPLGPRAAEWAHAFECRPKQFGLVRLRLLALGASLQSWANG